ncbi:MAG: winged helix DNA-binding domain-containing protein, partial [Tannerella sp.]|nr:winged helix DNA-binding domain-containing protein [Tannerella sp.]
MEVSDIIYIRLANHQLIGTELKKPHEIVSWLGAVQAQNFNMAKWAIGVRLPGITDGDVEQAINQGEIIRTHIMRPTWHLVAKDDIRWMLELTAPRIISALRSSDKILEITPDVLKKAYSIIEKKLQKGIHPTRQEIGKMLTANKISCEDSRRLNHIMYHAELDGFVCNGTIRGKQQTYCLLDEKAPKTGVFHKEEALEKLARKYFQSHSP